MFNVKVKRVGCGYRTIADLVYSNELLSKNRSERSAKADNEC